MCTHHAQRSAVSQWKKFLSSSAFSSSSSVVLAECLWRHGAVCQGRGFASRRAGTAPATRQYSATCRERGADQLFVVAREHVAVREHRRRSEEHTSELQSLRHLVCRLLLEKKK